MSRLYAIVSVCLIFLLAVALPVSAQPCPDPGSGADGVAVFGEACVECPDGPVTTCNGEFTVELVNFEHDLTLNLVTYSYEVYKVPEVPGAADLDHWVLGLDMDRFQECLADGKTLSDLFVACSVDQLAEGTDCGLVLPDPTTQLDGVKFEAALADGETQTFSLTLDEMALAPGVEIGTDCVVAATKAGEEDIQRAERPVPGYVCVAGPVCVGEPGPFACPFSHGYWKNHPDAWPVESVTLGSRTYTKDQARWLMWIPPRGDASLILARQLIAAKLNIENGSDPAPASDAIASADNLLSGYAGDLPYGVRTFTSSGKAMLQEAQVLDQYNNGWLTPDCE